MKMSKWKYVMFSVMVPFQEGHGLTEGTTIKEIPVLFPPEFSHKVMADGVQRGIGFDRDRFSLRMEVNPVSAGFVEFFTRLDETIGIRVSGESETLRLGIRPEDAVTIAEVQKRNPFFY
jgi:hypothetical protein